jgi:Fic family protein
MSQKYEDIIQFVMNNKACSSSDIHAALESTYSLATIKRILQQLVADEVIKKTGSAKSTRYHIPISYHLLRTVNIDEYYQKDIDERKINNRFNFNLIRDILPKVDVFTKKEKEFLEQYQVRFTKNSSRLSKFEFEKEMERLAIDLSWKSSQIEGNTYSLLETEQLLKEKKTAAGKTKDEAIMLLNHKEAIDFIADQPDYMYPLTVRKLEDLHSILMKELAVSRNIRSNPVGISGTNYIPLDNEFQIREALQEMCDLVNSKENVFEKGILTLLLISYLQPFVDGNKRTARIACNAILLHFNHCPLSFRTVDSIDYKKAILLFYEINNLSAFKKLFIEQYEFAVNTYF